MFIRLTEKQITLYDYSLRERAQAENLGRAAALFSNFHEFQRICTHPRVLMDKSNDVKIAKEKRVLHYASLLRKRNFF